MKIKAVNIKRILSTLLWMCLGAATVFVLISAVRVSDNKTCKDVHVEITGVSNNFFIDKKEVLNIILRLNKDKVNERPIAEFNLKAMEAALNTEVWIKRADLYFDNNHILQVRIDEREPVARIFSVQGNSFFLDSTAAVLPLSDKLSALVPVFTGFFGTTSRLTARDSLLLKQIRNMGLALQKDTFLMAMTEQIDIDGAGQFVLIPKIGKQLILFGTGTQIPQKFSKLKLFYREVMVKAGWGKYSTIDLQYEGQVVAKIRGKEDVKADSLRTIHLMNLMAIQAEQRSADSALLYAAGNDNGGTDISSIQQSVEREEPMEAALQGEILPAIANTIAPENLPLMNIKLPTVTNVATPSSSASPVNKTQTITANTKAPIKKLITPVKTNSEKRVKATVKPAKPKPKATVKPKPKIVVPPSNEY